VSTLKKNDKKSKKNQKKIKKNARFSNN